MCLNLILAICALLEFAMITGCSASAIDVEFKFHDVAGHQLPYVTVWRVVHVPDSDDPAIELTMPEAWRIANRYRDDLEMHIKGHRLVPDIDPVTMGDQAGRFAEKLDYQEVAGRGKRRPDPLNFGYVFLKRGYLPAKVEYFAPLGRKSVRAEITLQDDPEDSPDRAPNNTEYMCEFERLRAILADDDKLRVVSEAQQAYFDSLWRRFEACAQQALAAGDKQTAARIYARMQYFPSIIYVGGKPAGYSMGDPMEPRFLAQAEKAYALNTDLPYLQMAALARKFQKLQKGKPFSLKQASPEEVEAFQSLMAEEIRLLEKYGDRVWPDYYLFRVYHHLAFGEYEKAWEWVDRAEKFESRFTDYSLDRKDIIGWMRLDRVPVPAEWRQRVGK